MSCEDKGTGARSSIGTNELPGNITGEIEFVFEILLCEDWRSQC